LGQLVGLAKLSKADALSCTGKEIEAILKAYQQGERWEWERVRWVATTIINYSGKLKRPLRPTELFKFDDEKKQSGITDLFKIAKNG
jgi:hypothetical protein